ncbi:protein PROCA1 isoform X4 [Delphinapterus leucas]|uniref:Protein PROCA1 isoform X4 n=1 Tax=Delphinapterus leucas TaxID=9749 RepID=A0A2Y9Q196_DELLE|nr:protein PROCA1 isoform X4 [Delphinapterus leucas]
MWTRPVSTSSSAHALSSSQRESVWSGSGVAGECRRANGGHWPPHSVNHLSLFSSPPGCKSYRPLSVAVIHHPIHRECGADYLNQEEEEKEEEEEEEESKPPIPTQVGPPALLTNTGMGMVTGTPDLAAPITIWRSESPTGKSQGNKMIKKIKKKKGKEKDKEEETDEKAKVKKKVKKGKLTKKKSPVKSESPPGLHRSLSPRELARMSESSADSWRDLESEDSYNDPGREEPSSEDTVESLSPRKREKNGVQAKKPRMKTSPVKKVNKRKSPPASNPNLS